MHRFSRTTMTTLVVASLLSGTALSEEGGVAAAPRDAREVLERYATTQEKLRSFVMKIRTTTETEFSLSRDYPDGLSPNLNGKWKCGHSSEFASDGERYSLHSEGWGQVEGLGTPLPGKKSCGSHLWEGRDGYTFRRNKLEGRQDDLLLCRGWNSRELEQAVAMNPAGGELFGHLWLDCVRADVSVSSGGPLRLRPEMETVAGSPCHVVGAATKAGRYALWFDPGHGFQLVRGEVVRRTGDILPYAGRPVAEGVELRASFRVTRLEQVDGTWVPMAADAEDLYTFPESPRDKGVVRRHMERTWVTLNPDHEKRRSFYPDFVTEGTCVTIVTERNGMGGRGGGHVWKDGRPVSVRN
jgi:hypothetical protein